jgi:hypothetical protein
VSVGDDAHGEVFDLRRAAVVLVEGLELDALVGLELDDFVRTGADRFRLGDVGVGALRHDAEIEVVEEAAIRLLEMEDDGLRVRRFDARDGRVAGFFDVTSCSAIVESYVHFTSCAVTGGRSGTSRSD